MACRHVTVIHQSRFNLKCALLPQRCDREKIALEQELEEAKRNIHDLSLRSEQLNNVREKECAEAATLEQELMAKLMNQVDQLQQAQDAHVARHKEDAQDWNGLAGKSLSQKQRQVFDIHPRSVQDGDPWTPSRSRAGTRG